MRAFVVDALRIAFTAMVFAGLEAAMWLERRLP
jgi:hypothetical protein